MNFEFSLNPSQVTYFSAMLYMSFFDDCSVLHYSYSIKYAKAIFRSSTSLENSQYASRQ